MPGSRFFHLAPVGKPYLKDSLYLVAFGENLRRLRTLKGFSQQSLANEVGMSPNHVFQIEKGVVNTSVSHCKAIADALGVPVIALFDF